jgi:predicted N-acetyltransferase YhbS
VSLQPLHHDDLPAADRIHRAAFGAELGVTDVFADVDFVRPRFHAHPDGGIGAYLDSELVGSVLASRWGEFGFLGPISVDPRQWGRGVGARLVGAGVDRFDEWGLRQSGLFTFAFGTKHVRLYERFGYRSQEMTPFMAKPVATGSTPEGWRYLSHVSPAERPDHVAAIRALTEAVFEGLDVTREIRAVANQGLGETLLLDDDAGVAAFAVCHLGAGTEAGSGRCYVKFGAVRPGAGAAERFEHLLDACESLAAARRAGLLMLGVNAARTEALALVSARGFQLRMQGVCMQRPDAPGYNRAGVYVVDDWR